MKINLELKIDVVALIAIIMVIVAAIYGQAKINDLSAKLDQIDEIKEDLKVISAQTGGDDYMLSGTSQEILELKEAICELYESAKHDEFTPRTTELIRECP